MSSITGSSFNAAAWLSQIEGVTPTPATTTTPTPSPTTSSTTPTPAPTTATGTATPGNLLGLSSSILSLLQETDSSSSGATQASELFGTLDASDPLDGLYGSLLAEDSSTLPTQVAVQTTQNQQQQQSADSNNQVQNILNGYNSALNAGDNTLIQNAQSVLNSVKNTTSS